MVRSNIKVPIEHFSWCLSQDALKCLSSLLIRNQYRPHLEKGVILDFLQDSKTVAFC